MEDVRIHIFKTEGVKGGVSVWALKHSGKIQVPE
jgi:hypothetical protein